MKIDTLGVQAFVAIAEAGSFGRAAEALHITQTGLTRRLQNLESFLGVKLVERTTRALALTGVGRDFLPQAKRLLAELSGALSGIRETGKAQRGDVTIACVPTVGIHYLPSIVRRYSTLHPENRIRILDHPSHDVVGAVRRREAEFGINILAPHDAELVSVPLMEDRFVLACRRDHALAARKRLTWKQLEPYPLIFAGHESGNRHLLDAALADAALELRAYYEVQHSSTAIGMVAEGIGAAVVPELALQKGSYPSLRLVPLTQPTVSRTIVLLSRRTAYLSPPAQALYDLIRSRASRA